MNTTAMTEKFSTTELSVLRNELMQGALDPWQAAELFQVFLAGHGYGVSPDAAAGGAPGPGAVSSAGKAPSNPELKTPI